MGSAICWPRIALGWVRDRAARRRLNVPRLGRRLRPAAGTVLRKWHVHNHGRQHLRAAVRVRRLRGRAVRLLMGAFRARESAHTPQGVADRHTELRHEPSPLGASTRLILLNVPWKAAHARPAQRGNGARARTIASTSRVSADDSIGDLGVLRQLEFPRFRRHLNASGRRPGKVRLRCRERGRRIRRSSAARRCV